jgi:hypothetical protein
VFLFKRCPAPTLLWCFYQATTMQRLCEANDTFGRGLNLEKYARQLQILPMLRKLHPITNKIIQDIALTFDIREDVVYQQGISDATKKAIIKMLTNNDLTVEQIANFQSVEVQDVLKIQTDLVRKKKK